MANLAAGQPFSSAGSAIPLSSNIDFPLLVHPNTHNNPVLHNDSTSLPIEIDNDKKSLKKDPYADILKMKNASEKLQYSVAPIPIKKVCYNNGTPRIIWTEEEVDRMNIIENLQYAVVGKFSYGWPELEDLRFQIPKQCNIKGECKIGLLRNRHILMRFTLQEDFINMMSKSGYYILAKDGFLT